MTVNDETQAFNDADDKAKLAIMQGIQAHAEHLLVQLDHLTVFQPDLSDALKSLAEAYQLVTH